MGKILINSCDFDDLLTVPGIGHDFALQIISLRESKGQITDRSFALFRFSMDPAIVDHAMLYFDFKPCHAKNYKLSQEQITENSLAQHVSSSCQPNSELTSNSSQSQRHASNHYNGHSHDCDTFTHSHVYNRSLSDSRNDSCPRLPELCNRSRGYSSISYNDDYRSFSRSYSGDHRSVPRLTEYRGHSPSSHSPDYEYCAGPPPSQSRDYQSDSRETAPQFERANPYSDGKSSEHDFLNHESDIDYSRQWVNDTSFDKVTQPIATKIEQKFNDLEDKIDSGFGKCEKQIFSLAEDVNNFQKQIPVLEDQRFFKFENQLTHLERKVDSISSGLDSFENRTGNKFYSVFQAIDSLQMSLKSLALSVQVLTDNVMKQTPYMCDKSCQIEPKCHEGRVENLLSVTSDELCDQDSESLQIGDFDITDLICPPPSSPLDFDITELICPPPLEFQDNVESGSRPVDQSLVSSEETCRVSPIPPLSPVLLPPQESSGMNAGQPTSSLSSLGSRDGLMLVESGGRNEQMLKGMSGPPIPPELLDPWRLPPWPPDRPSTSNTGEANVDERVDTSPILSSVPAPIGSRTNSVPPMPSFFSSGGGSGLSLKEMKVRVQVPDKGDFFLGNPPVPSPLSQHWCLPPWPPPL